MDGLPAASRRGPRLPVLLALGLLVLGVAGAASRLDGAGDGTVLRLGWSTWQPGGAVVTVLGAADRTPLRTGDLVTAIAGRRLAEGLGGLPSPQPGDQLDYVVAPDDVRTVRVLRPDPAVLLADGWGDLAFVLALGGLACALYQRRPDEPATGPLLVAAAGLLGSTLTVVAGLPALALATGGAQLWLFQANAVGAYSVAWGAVIATALRFTPHHPWLARARWVLPAASAGPAVVMAGWTASLAVAVDDPLRRLGLLGAGQTAVSVAALVTAAAAGTAAYRGSRDRLTRGRLRWVAGGGLLTAVVAVAGWSLPELLAGVHALPSGALGLSGLPFVAGLAFALRRHRLFDIERLVNRSLVSAGLVAILVAVYAATVALLLAALHLSDALASALAAAVAALVLAPLRSAAQAAVNRLMYGQRDDPAGVLAGLGDRLQAVVRPDEVPATVVATVTRSLRVPYAAVDLADGAGGFRTAAEHGCAAGPVHVEPLRHLGETVGRLRVAGRGPDDPLEQVDLTLIRSLAHQAGPAVAAVRLHDDVLRSRAEVVASREDERRRLRRELHDGVGPALAAIALKVGLAARQVPAGSARCLLGEVSDEVQASIGDVRRVVDGLRPPALDELGLIGALRARAESLTGDLAVEVTGPQDRPALPAAVETAAYRIAVEAITNAVRHSDGRGCTVAVEVGAAELELCVRDDGCGLPARPSPGVGLRSMRERAAELGGVLRVETAAGGGTLVRARLPLDGLPLKNGTGP